MKNRTPEEIKHLKLQKLETFLSLLEVPTDVLLSEIQSMDDEHTQIHIKMEARQMLVHFRVSGLSNSDIQTITERARRILNGEEKEPEPESAPDMIDVILDILQQRR